MGKHTAITWTDSTWNPWRGCHKVSAGCQNCYMYRDQHRYGNDPNVVVQAGLNTFNAPLHWKEPRRVFTCSWSDFFIEEADEWRPAAWNIIRNTPHTYQILTKRPENIAARLPYGWSFGWPNVWLGVTVENAENLGRVDVLRQVPASLLFVSYEPALGPVDFYPAMATVGWLISGGESGPGCRPADPQWFRDALDICDECAVPFFHKQNGGTKKEDGVWGGDRIDGQQYHNFPESQI